MAEAIKQVLKSAHTLSRFLLYIVKKNKTTACLYICWLCPIYESYVC